MKIIHFIQPNSPETSLGLSEIGHAFLNCSHLSLQFMKPSTTKTKQIFYMWTAFDSVPHQELLFKMWQMGITGPLWSWLPVNAYMLRQVNGTNSTSLSGGNILSPLVFIDLPNSITYTACCMFADDTKLIKSIYNHLLFQQDITTVEAWCCTWKLPLNTAKCNAVKFTLAQQITNTPKQCTCPLSKVIT